MNIKRDQGENLVNVRVDEAHLPGVPAISISAAAFIGDAPKNQVAMRT